MAKPLMSAEEQKQVQDVLIEVWHRADNADEGFDKIEDIILVMLQNAYNAGEAAANFHHATLKFEEDAHNL